MGVFDGLHLGHQHLIRKMIKRSRAIHGTSIVVTFYPHPIRVLKPEKYLPLVISLNQRLKLIASLGVDVCIIIRFTKKFSNISHQSFVKDYLIKYLKVKEIFIGQDFHFGKGREGDVKFLEQQSGPGGFCAHVVPPVKVLRTVVSSTKIRNFILSGDLLSAQKLLGRPFSILGIVKKGKGRGRRLGYPTANLIAIDEIIPSRGVYVVKVGLLGKVFDGIANVGVRPSFGDNKEHIVVETHIFNFNKIIYNIEMEVFFLKRIRDEIKFASKDKLIEQIRKDEMKARKIASLKRIPSCQQ